jgi:phosphatidylserine/phosphatidylglycerophosphate/cardiolipin synthase-like enzyme
MNNGHLSYSGQNTYKYIEPIISKKSHILLISSPYIDFHYANFILKHSKHKKIYLLSSSISNEAKHRLENTRKLNNIFAILLIFIGIIMLTYFFKLYTIGVIIAIICIILIYFQIKLSLVKPQIILKIPKSFVHAKIYVSEGIAAEGSTNLTYRGMHNNIEHITLTENSDGIKELEKQFWDIWNTE